jgi:hypothetical protein
VDQKERGRLFQAPRLRPYQESDVAGIREAFADGATRVLYVAPTGS